MAVTSVTTSMAGAINYTVVTDNSSDWTSVANSTYFYDKATKIVYYKDANGIVQNTYRNLPSVQSVASAATVTPTANDDIVVITAQATALTLAAPTGSPVQGQALIIRIKDNGAAQTIAWNAIYRAIGVTLPTTTVLSKTTYVGLIYNSDDNRWDAIGVTTQA